MITKEYIHIHVGEEVETAAGRYVILKEGLLSAAGRQVLYVVAAGEFDRSCCGAGGCGYALVPGFVTGLKVRTDAFGRAVSEVEPVENEAERQTITAALCEREAVSQVNFL